MAEQPLQRISFKSAGLKPPQATRDRSYVTDVLLTPRRPRLLPGCLLCGRRHSFTSRCRTEVSDA